MVVQRRLVYTRANILAICFTVGILLWSAPSLGHVRRLPLRQGYSAGTEDASYDPVWNAGDVRPSAPLAHTEPLRPKICQDANTSSGRENATILILARNGNAYELARTLRNFESTFNARFRYPYTLLNEEDFSSDFKQTILEALPAGAAVEFAGIPREQWGIPEWLDRKQVYKWFAELEQAGVMYGNKATCAGMGLLDPYFSGLFALNPALARYRYYWRLEPSVHFYCQTTYDPFQYLRESKKIYGFNMALYETNNTIPSLFNNVVAWRDSQMPLMRNHKASNLWSFLTQGNAEEEETSEASKEAYNNCHFWTNFEIGDLDFFRGEAYQSLFRHLDESGGFYFERWGDAPIRSLALGLLAEKDQVHYFEDIAYQHWPYLHYPDDKALLCKCEAPPSNMIASDYHNLGLHKGETCIQKWKALS